MAASTTDTGGKMRYVIVGTCNISNTYVAAFKKS